MEEGGREKETVVEPPKGGPEDTKAPSEEQVMFEENNNNLEKDDNQSGPEQQPQELRTSDFYKVDSTIPKRFDHPEWFQGYGAVTSKNPFYETSGSKYGGKPPTVHTMPTKFSGRSQKFTGSLGPFGMYRNHSLNTDMDRSKVLANKYL